MASAYVPAGTPAFTPSLAHAPPYGFELAQLVLLFGEREVHVCLSYRGAIGMPSPKTVMRSRWTSLTPPPNVRITSERYMCSSLAASTAPGEPRFTYAGCPITSI